MHLFLTFFNACQLSMVVNSSFLCFYEQFEIAEKEWKVMLHAPSEWWKIAVSFRYGRSEMTFPSGKGITKEQQEW